MTDSTPSDDRDDLTDPDYRASFDAATGNVTEELLYAVAEARDVDPTDLPRLSTVLDPDALDGLFETFVVDETDRERERSSPVCVSFEYDGQHVEVTSDGTIALWRLAE